MVSIKADGPVARTTRRAGVALAAALALGLVSLPGGAETTTTSTPSSTSSTAPTSAESTTTTSEPTSSTTDATSPPGEEPTADELQAERARLEAAEAAKARQVDAANAQLSEVTAALATLQARVEAQEARVDYANSRYRAAQALVATTTEEVAQAESELADLEGRLSDQAIRSFMGDEGDRVIHLDVADPNEIIRRQTMLAEATQTDLDLIGQLRAGREDLEVRQAEAVEAVAVARAFQTEANDQLATLQDDQQAQAVATAAAEQRLDHLLSERAALAALGEEAAAGLPVADDLVDQLASSPAPRPTGDTSAPSVVTEDDIAYAGNGIYVHVSIVDDVRQLLADAAAEGIELAGGGFRSPERQIETRRNNCGTSNYAIYEMPASQCRPPTARPGRSMHEQGKAIDFTYNGALIRSRSGRGWAWLRDNAARYGLKNLPSEPWHWSVNGR